MRVGIRRSPLFAISVIAVSGFVVGLVTAVFSIGQAVLLRPVPFPEPEQLVALGRTRPDAPTDFFASLPDYLDWQEWSAPWLRDVGVVFTERMSVATPGGARELAVGRTTPSLWSTLQVIPLLGRAFNSRDVDAGARRVALLTESLWRTAFGASPAVIGSSVIFAGQSQESGEAFEIVGVLPRSANLSYLDGPDGPSVFVPLDTSGIDRASTNTYRRVGGYVVIGRVREGGTVDSVRAALGKMRPVSYGPHTDEDRLGVRSLHTAIVGSGERGMTILFLAAALVILVGVANLSGLFLTQVHGRSRQLAIQVALGATRGRLFRELMGQAVALSAGGALLGVVAAPMLLRLIVSSIPVSLPRIGETTIDDVALVFAVTVAVLLGVTAALLPAWRAGTQSIRSTAADSWSGTRHFRRLLLAAQLSLVVWLLLAAGGLLSSLWRLYVVPTGFDSDVLSAMQVNPRYQGGGQRGLGPESYDVLLHGVTGLPRVAGVSLVFPAPFFFSSLPSALTLRAGQATIQEVTHVYVLPAYFTTMGIKLLAGRDFQRHEAEPAGAVIISAELARRAFGDADPIGKEISGGLGLRTVIGVVADARYDSLVDQVKPTIYLPFPKQITAVPWLLVRWSRLPADLRTSLREPVRNLLPAGFILADPVPLDSLIDRKRADTRFFAILVAMFAATSTVLGASGMFASAILSSQARRKEIAIRQSLGATPVNITGLLARESVAILVVGLTVGYLGNLATSRVIAAVIEGAPAADGLLTVCVTLLLSVGVLLVSMQPAWRVAHADPLGSLRAD